MIAMSPQEMDQFERLAQNALPGLPEASALRLQDILARLRTNAGIQERELQEMMLLLTPEATAPAPAQPEEGSPYARERRADAQRERETPAVLATKRLLDYLQYLQRDSKHQTNRRGRKNTRL